MSGSQCPCPETDEFCDPPSNECKPCHDICKTQYGAVNGYESRMNSCARHCPKYTKHLPITKQETAAAQTTTTLPTRYPVPQIQHVQAVGSNGGNVLGAGAIAGVIGGVIILAVIAFVAAMFLLHKNKKKEKTKRKASAKEEEIPLQAIHLEAPPRDINLQEEETPLQNANHAAAIEYEQLNEQTIVSEDQNTTNQRWNRARSKSLARPVGNESQHSPMRNSQQRTTVPQSGSQRSITAEIHSDQQKGPPASRRKNNVSSHLANSLGMDASPVTDSSEMHVHQNNCGDPFPDEPQPSELDPSPSRPRKSSLKKSNSTGCVAETQTDTHPIQVSEAQQEGYKGQSSSLPNGRNPLCCVPETSVQFTDELDTTEVKSRHQTASVLSNT